MVVFRDPTDAVLHVLPAADPDRRVRFRAGQRREAHGDGGAQRGPHRGEPRSWWTSS